MRGRPGRPVRPPPPDDDDDHPYPPRKRKMTPDEVTIWIVALSIIGAVAAIAYGVYLLLAR